MRLIPASVTLAMVAAAPLLGVAASLQLPEPTIPSGLLPYIDESKILGNAVAVADALGTARLSAEQPTRGTYVGSRQGNSRCSDDADMMAIHRGLAWTAVAYGMFAAKQEGKDLMRAMQTVDRSITRYGRAVILRRLDSGKITRMLTSLTDKVRLPISTRSEIVAFLKTLLLFRIHHDRLVARGESIRDWMVRPGLFDKSTEKVGDELVARINELRAEGEPEISECLGGYADQFVTLASNQAIYAGGIYSGGIAMYAVGFWWRREGEGTTLLAEQALRYVITRLEN